MKRTILFAVALCASTTLANAEDNIPSVNNLPTDYDFIDQPSRDDLPYNYQEAYYAQELSVTCNLPETIQQFYSYAANELYPKSSTLRHAQQDMAYVDLDIASRDLSFWCAQIVTAVPERFILNYFQW